MNTSLNATILGMDDQAVDQRIEFSLRVVARWERGSLSSYSKREALRMVRVEIATLEGLALSNPHQAVKITRVIERYSVFIAKLGSNAMLLGPS